jgi:hypothetical protein
VTFRMWRVQFFGTLLLMLLVWEFLNTPDQRAWQVGASGLLALLSVIAATWLIAANLAGAAMPARMPLVLGCLALLIALLWIVGLIDGKSWDMSNWLGSALTMKRKEPVTPDSIHRAIDWILFLVRWIVAPLLVLPLGIRAAGAKPVRFWRLALTWIVLFLMGAVLPHAIVHHVPGFPGFWTQILSAAGRFLVAYLLMITAWVILGRSAREAAPN